MEPEFIEKGPMIVAGILTHGQPDNLDYNDIWANQYMKYDAQIRPFSPDQSYYGIWLSDGEQGLAYLAGMMVENLPEVPEGVALRVIPGAKYAVFPCTISTIGKTYSVIYDQWLPPSPYELDPEKSDFEFYPPSQETGDQAAAIYVPIRLKTPQPASPA